jgi:biotin carboxylase
MVVEGLPTTIPLFLKILDDEEFVAGKISTDFVPRKYHT